MTRWRWLLVALGVFALFWALGGEWQTIHHGVTENHFLDAMVGLSFFVAGLIAMDRRPGNAIGPLMYAYAFCWFLGNWGTTGVQPLLTLGFVGGSIGTAFLVHIFFAYPSGRVGTTLERSVLVAVYAIVFVGNLVIAITWDPQAFGCRLDCPSTNAPLANLSVFEFMQNIVDKSAIVFVPLFLAIIALRWRRSTRAHRRELTPLWIAAGLLALVNLIGAFASRDTSQPFPYLLWELQSVFQLAVPLVFVWGLVSTRLQRSAVGDLVVELERPLPPGALRAALSRTLGDPSVQMAYAIEDERRWVDEDGRAVSLPTPGDPKRAATIVEREGVPLAALIHDPALDESLVRSAGAAAGMAIANERLRAEVRAQLEEVRASRQRIVEAGDRERRRVERNLHDGAQQRLVTISLALAMLRDRPELEPSLAAGLERTAAELKCAIDELRELARGIHPAILTEEGLEAAVESLADRSSLPVSVTSGLGGRLPDGVEATAYYVVSEALANVAKYANATGASVELARRNGFVRVSVTDDGVGGASLDGGSGLRGLKDRVAAVGGRLEVRSAPGAGTTVVAEMPADG